MTGYKNPRLSDPWVWLGTYFEPAAPFSSWINRNLQLVIKAENIKIMHETKCLSDST